MLQLFLQNGNSKKSLDFVYSTFLSYGLGMGAKITCLKTFMLHPLWVSLGSPCPFWCRGVVGPKPFAVAQCALSTCCKSAVQTADTACLQIGGLCWYPSEGTFVTWVIPMRLSLRLPYFCYLGYFCYLWVIEGLWVIICCVYKFGEY